MSTQFNSTNEKIINLVHSHPGGGAGTAGEKGAQPCSLVLEKEGRTRNERENDGITRMYLNLEILKKILIEYGYQNLENLTAESFDQRCNNGEFAKLTSTDCGVYLGLYACDKISKKTIQEISDYNQNGIRENGEKVRKYPPTPEQNKKLETHISFSNLAETGEPIILEGTFDSRHKLQKALEATSLRYTSTFIIGPKAEEIAMRMVGRDNTGTKSEYKKSKEVQNLINTITNLYRTEIKPKPVDENGVKEWAVQKVEQNSEILKNTQNLMDTGKDWKELVKVIGRGVWSGEVERNKILDNYNPSEGVLAFNINGEFNQSKKEIYGDSTDTFAWVRHLGRNLDNKEKLELNRQIIQNKTETKQEISNWAKLQAQDETAVWRKNLSSLLKAQEYNRVYDYQKDFDRLKKAYESRRMYLLENGRPKIILPLFETMRERSEKHFEVELAGGFANQKNTKCEKARQILAEIEKIPENNVYFNLVLGCPMDLVYVDSYLRVNKLNFEDTKNFLITEVKKLGDHSIFLAEIMNTQNIDQLEAIQGLSYMKELIGENLKKQIIKEAKTETEIQERKISKLPEIR